MGVTDLTHLLRGRFRALPHGLVFSIRQIGARAVIVYDEQERKERSIPRVAIEIALRRRKLVYLGMERRRSA